MKGMQSRKTVIPESFYRESGSPIQAFGDDKVLSRSLRKKAFRLIDANFNRVKEGLRVCEDIFRFIYDDTSLTRSFKKLRHDCSRVLLKFPVSYRTLVGMRDAKEDVGKVSAISERKKPSWRDLIMSNMKRAEEGFRVLEEASKVVAKKGASQFQSLRFRLYELEKRVFKKI